MLSFVNVLNSEGQHLYGTMHVSETARKGVVVVVHGQLSSNRIGPHRLYYDLSVELSKAGYDVIRFDLRGMGESDGVLGENGFEAHVNDVITVLNYAKRVAGRAAILVVAHCVGCNICLKAIQKCEGISGMVLLAPFFANEDSLRSMFTEQQLGEMQENGVSHRKGIMVCKEMFIDACAQNRFLEDVNAVKEKVTIIYGTLDQFIKLEDWESICNLLKCRWRVIDKADHNFLETQPRRELISEVSETMDYYLARAL